MTFRVLCVVRRKDFGRGPFCITDRHWFGGGTVDLESARTAAIGARFAGWRVNSW